MFDQISVSRNFQIPIRDTRFTLSAKIKQITAQNPQITSFLSASQAKFTDSALILEGHKIIEFLT